MFYAKIDDHGIRQGNTGQILARWRCPVASRVALDLLYWVMRSAPYHLIHMAIEMASKICACFSVIDFMPCINVVKQPCLDLDLDLDFIITPPLGLSAFW